MNNLYKSVLSVVVVAALVSTIIGVSYSNFTSNLTGEGVISTIVNNDGKMVITYADNDNKVLLNNITSSKEAVYSKRFAVDGTNNNDLKIEYSIYLTIENNNFVNDSLSCSLIGRSLKKNQDLIYVKNLNIPNNGELKLGTGSFTNANSNIHEYELNIYYNNNNAKNNFAGKIIVKEGNN